MQLLKKCLTYKSEQKKAIKIELFSNHLKLTDSDKNFQCRKVKNNSYLKNQTRPDNTLQSTVQNRNILSNVGIYLIGIVLNSTHSWAHFFQIAELAVSFR